MNLLKPSYYQQFQCIAGRCKHSCCVGWEIDIDEETYLRYQSFSGPLGERLQEHISVENTPHFILDDKERCPFLNEDNLCDIIVEKGENALCQICTDHPRFRNFYTHYTEIGLGLCCEAAGELILSQKERFFVPEADEMLLTEEEKCFFRFRKEIFRMIQEREFSLKQRVENLLSKYQMSFPDKSNQEWADIFLSLERLDETWGRLLREFSLSEELLPLDKEWEIPLEQLLCYFVYRHLAQGLSDGCFRERILFSVLGLWMISSLFRMVSSGGFSMDKLVEIARLYSSEIEYSEENIQALLKLFE